MKKSDYLFYSEYLKYQNTYNKIILISKTNNSYLIGPLINEQFDKDSFYKRLMSNNIYSPNIYKKFSRKKCEKLFKSFSNSLSDNEAIEVFKDGSFIKHRIIKVPGDCDEKE